VVGRVVVVVVVVVVVEGHGRLAKQAIFLFLPPPSLPPFLPSLAGHWRLTDPILPMLWDL